MNEKKIFNLIKSREFFDLMRWGEREENESTAKAKNLFHFKLSDFTLKVFHEKKRTKRASTSPERESEVKTSQDTIPLPFYVSTKYKSFNLLWFVIRRNMYPGERERGGKESTAHNSRQFTMDFITLAQIHKNLKRSRPKGKLIRQAIRWRFCIRPALYCCCG
jgi:hypothetical protein